MLTGLHIENIAIIDCLDVEMTAGFIVLTGETGAGKSIIIDAVNMLLGERVSKDIVRSGEKKAYVSASFSGICGGARKKLGDYGFECPDDELILSRELSSEGKSTARVNGRPANISVLRDIGTELVNIHGQHDNTALLRPETHLGFLDSYAKNKTAYDEYLGAFQRAVSLRKQIEALSMDDEEKKKRTELLRYQIDEIEAADIKENEEESLEQKLTVLSNSEKILESITSVREKLSENELNIRDMLASCVREAEYLSRYDGKLKEIYEKLYDISETAEDISASLSDYSDTLTFDPRELEKTDERLDVIRRIKKKYGGDVSELQGYLENAKKELGDMEFSDENLVNLNEEFRTAKNEMKIKSQLLTKSRAEAAVKLEKAIVDTLTFLEMPKVRFSVGIKPKKYDRTGADEVEFLLSANPGEELKPLYKIASGGELSRIMLSIKNVLTDGSVQTMIFDEIDTGISGRAAQKVAIKLKEMSSCGQVIAVTHLAQIAAYADTHFKIVKETDVSRTHTLLKRLDTEARRDELARIMGGMNITESLLNTAEEMLKLSHNIKV